MKRCNMAVVASSSVYTGHSFVIVIDWIGRGVVSMNEEDNIPKSRFKLSFSSNPRMT